MIDIHAHVLPGVDDGSSDWEESLTILRRGVEDGIRGVVCTSHVLDRLDGEVEKEFIEKFEELKRRVEEEGLNVSLWLGSEIHCHAQFDLRFKVATLNGTGKYLLFELPMGEIPQNVEDKLFHLSLEGVTPILAHPERNGVILRSPKVAYEWVRRGVLVQLNAGSVTGFFGKGVKRTAFTLLDHRMVHFVASDCHSSRKRPMVLSRAYRVIVRRWGEEVAEQLFRFNPYRVVVGQEISPPSPLSLGERGNKVVGLFGLKIFGNR